ANKTSVFVAGSEGSWILRQEYFPGIHRFSVVSASPDGYLALRTSPPQRPVPGVYRFEHVLGSGSLSSGEVRSDLLKFSEREQLVLESGAFNPLPFGRETLFATDRFGRVYLLWNESLEIR